MPDTPTRCWRNQRPDGCPSMRGEPALSEAPDWRRLDIVKLLERISIDPAVRFGKPCVRGTRITVGDVLGYLAGGTTEEQLLADFPQLSPEDVRACLAYAAERERRTVGVPAARLVRLLFDDSPSESQIQRLTRPAYPS